MPRFILALVALALFLSRETACAQAYGLTARPSVAPYLDGVMPAQPPVLGTNWSTVIAFPNLTFLNPLGLLPLPGTTKLVVWEREGRVYSFENNPATAVATKTLILDIHNQCQGWDDEGLLGMAFHPSFATNHYVYLWYNWVTPGTVIGDPNTRPPNGTSTHQRLARYTFNTTTGVLENEYVVLDQIDHNTWHNGGGMFFHPVNGFLYLTNGNDANGANDQTISGGLFGGLLRIDVDKRGGAISHAPTVRATEEVGPNWPNAYYIPNDNPFVGVSGAREEFFGIGLRSPHRATVDAATNRIFIGDVGEGAREEVDVIEPNDPAGLNFQWHTIEGYGGDLTPPYLGVNKRPMIDYAHGTDGNAVIGGYVYRGSALPELIGKYLFADNITNKIWYLDETTHTATTPASKVLMAVMPKGTGPNSGSDYTGISSWGYDAAGELYLCQLSSLGGYIYKLQRGGPAQGAPLPATLSATGVFSNTAALTPGAKIIPYALNQPFWSDGAIKSRWASVPNTANIGFTATGEWTWPEGSVLVKHFDLPVDDTNPAIRKRLETRLIVKTATNVYGVSYKWRADNSDADLMEGGITENIPVAIAPVGTLTSADIGAPALAGSTARTGDVVTMTAGGTDIWNNADQFRFAYQQRTGDFDIWVRLESLTQADLYSKAGLMARESLAAGSRHVFACAFSSNAARNNNNGGYEWQHRDTTDGASAAIYPAVPQPQVNYPNTWVRLQRQGNVFIGYSSVDGVLWSEFARQTSALPATVYFGLAATAHTAAATTTAKFDLQSTRPQPWYYPSRADCITCHNANAGGVLGPKTRQLNGNLLYPNAVTDNQLRSWLHIGLFNNAPLESAIPTFDALAALADTSATLEKRSRSYLDANCAQCHRPGSGVQAFWDARFDTPLAQQGIVYGRLNDHLGDPTACVVVPQDLTRSVLHHRVSIVGPNQMPPLAKNMIDSAGVNLLAQWIGSLTPNTPPVVTLTSPPTGAVFSQTDTITLAATASDADGIARVEFYDGTTKIGEDTAAPYSFAWVGAGRGAHSIYAVAVDNVGNTGVSAMATITVQSAPIIGWAHDDVGNVGLPGDANYTAATGTFTVDGSGDDIWNTADAFHYVYRPLTGDGTITARVVSLQNTDGWAKAGVMMRETIATGSKHSLSLISVGNGAGNQFRTATDGASGVAYGPGVTAPYWVRLVRAGNNFSAYSSPDGLAANPVWTLISTQAITMNSTVYAGLAITAHNNGTLNEAVFDHVTLTTTGPTIALTTPAANATFYNPATVTLGATATASSGTISFVEFYVDGTFIGMDTSAPYSFVWTTPAYGTHEFTARAIDTAGRPTTSAPVRATLNIPGAAGFRGEYYNDAALTNLVFVRLDAAINFDYGYGSPDPRIGPDTFSVRWSGSIRPRYTETYTITPETDDGVRLWINGQLLINQWVVQGPTRVPATIALVANQSYDLVMEYYENSGSASAKLYWSSASQAEEFIPASRVTVPPPVNAPPSVWLSAPLATSAYLSGDTIALNANATDSDGTIARVEFWADGVKLGESNAAPYLWNWSGPRGSGAHSLWATAFDNGGASSTSVVIPISSMPLALTPAAVQQLSGPARIVATLRTTLPAGRTYVIEWSADFTTWTPLQSGTSTGAQIEVIDTTTGVQKRFYRTRVTN